VKQGAGEIQALSREAEKRTFVFQVDDESTVIEH
jgi:hypothetical protein